MPVVVWLVPVIGLLIICFGGVLLVGAPYLPTLTPQIRAALELAEVRPGNTFLELRHFDEAIADYVKAIGLNPFLIEAYCNQVSALLDLNRLEEAFAVSDKALALGPNFAQAWITRGDVLRNLRRYEEALTSYDCFL